MQHLPALMTPQDFKDRTERKTTPFQGGGKLIRSSILKKIHQLLLFLPPKTMLQSRWYSLDKIARLCALYVIEKEPKLKGSKTSPKLDAVQTLLIQVVARRSGEERHAKELHDRVTSQPTQVLPGRLSPGKGVGTAYTWEKAISNQNTRIHGENARTLAGEGKLGPVELMGTDWTEVRADDLYALKALFKGLEWQEIQQKVLWVKQLVYIGPDQREEYKLHFVGPTIYNSRLEPADTSSSQVRRELGASVYAATQEGDLYTIADFDDARDQGTYQHTSLLSGGEVMCAGTIKIREGQLITISNLSGHYRPGLEELVDVCAAIKDQYENPAPAYALYADFQGIYDPGGGHYLIPMGLFIHFQGKPSNPRHFGGDWILKANNWAWEYTNPQAAKARGGATQI